MFVLFEVPDESMWSLGYLPYREVARGGTFDKFLDSLEARETERRRTAESVVDFELIDAIGRAREAGDPHADADTTIITAQQIADAQRDTHVDVLLMELDEST